LNGIDAVSLESVHLTNYDSYKPSQQHLKKPTVTNMTHLSNLNNETFKTV